MTSPERRVAVVTDSGSSIRPEDEIAKELGVTILPLQVTFYEDGQAVSIFDTEISAEEFYPRMEKSEKLPTTSGAIPGLARDAYIALSEKTNRILSVHITSKHSAAYESAITGAQMAREERPEHLPELLIEVVDSKNISLGTWFLAERAARLAQQGAGLEEIKEEVLATIPKIGLLAVLSQIENLKKGGRVPAVQAIAADLLDIKPILGIIDGEIQVVGRARGIPRAKKEMMKRVKDEPGIVRMAILHTNAPEMAEEVREAIAEFYKKDLPIHEIGPVLGVHAGEGTVGVIFERD